MIDMTKRSETALVSLQKMVDRTSADLGELSAQITCEIDFSGSMDHLYRAGVVQEAVERALALSLTGLDEDGIVPVTFFHHSAFKPINVTEDNYVGVVQEFVNSHSMGGTNYADAVRNALGSKRSRFGRKQADAPTDPPNLHLFFTDGEPNDRDVTEKLIVAARERPHFFQFILLGTSREGERYLDYLNNNMVGPGIDNVGVTKYADAQSVTDEQFFDDVVSEFFPVWLPQARSAGYCQ